MFQTQDEKLGYAADSYGYNYLQSENGKRGLDEDVAQQNGQDGTIGAARNTDSSANSNLRSEVRLVINEVPNHSVVHDLAKLSSKKIKDQLLCPLRHIE